MEQTLRSTWDEAVMITVRDRRQRHQFSIHNRLIDEWWPIIDRTGFTLYSLYVRMANNEDERCYPGFEMIEEHFGFSSPTISNYNDLLVWCRLIHRERYWLPSGRRYRNDYFVLDIPEVTKEELDRLHQRVALELKRERESERPNGRRVRFCEMVLGRIAGWESLRSIWERRGRPKKEIVVTRAQLELDLVGGGDTVDNSGVAVSSGQCSTVLRTVPHCPQDRGTLSSGQGDAVPRTVEQSEENNPNMTIRREQSTDNTVAIVLSDEDVDVLLHGLVDAGIEDGVAGELLDVYGPGVVERQLGFFSDRLVAYERKGETVDNPAGLLVGSIQGDWSAPALPDEVAADGQPGAGYPCCKSCFRALLRTEICPDCGKGSCCCECGDS